MSRAGTVKPSDSLRFILILLEKPGAKLWRFRFIWFWVVRCFF